MVEYLLILVLTIAMVMALSKGIGRPLKSYIQNNILSVVGCMLRVGQFPTKSFGLCSEAVKIKFNVTESFANESGSSSKSSSSSSNNKNRDLSGEDKNAPNSGNKNSPKTPYKPSNSTGSLNGSDQFESSSGPKAIKVNGDLDSADSNEISINGFKNSHKQTIVIRRIHKNNRIGGSFFISEKEKEAKNSAPPKKQAKSLPPSLIQDKVTVDSFAIPKSKNNTLKNPQTDDGIKFSFLGIIKWGIIITIIVFFGFFTMSQINSIRKGWTD